MKNRNRKEKEKRDGCDEAGQEVKKMCYYMQENIRRKRNRKIIEKKENVRNREWQETEAEKKHSSTYRNKKKTKKKQKETKGTEVEGTQKQERKPEKQKKTEAEETKE